MTKCYINFPNEVCEGSIGTKEEVMMFLRDLKYDFEGIQKIRNREEHKWERVVVYSLDDYWFGTCFVCHKAE